VIRWLLARAGWALVRLARIRQLEGELVAERARSRAEFERGLAAGRAGLIAELAADRRRDRVGLI
jgi:hypothetical protein